MKAPQIIVIIYLTIALTISLTKHGEDRGEYNFWSTLVDVVFIIAILILGGFFN